MKRRSGRARVWVVVLLGVLGTAAVAAQQQPNAVAKDGDDTIRRAMRDELARSMEKLQLAQLDRPYFIAYRVRESRGLEVGATCGSLMGSSSEDSVTRTLSVEVRVGDYNFDNTNFISRPSFSPGTIRPQFGFNALPIDDDYLEFRRQIWLATDGAYKQALEQLAGKKAALQNRTRAEDLPDFSKESTTQIPETAPAIRMERTRAEAMVRELSRVLGAMPGINSSSVSLSVGNGRTFYLNSEGTEFEKSRPLITISAEAATQAVDGLKLSDSDRFYFRSVEVLPPREALAERIRGLAARLESLRNAPLLARYNGPVLFEGRAAAEVFGEQFAPALIGQRKPDTGVPGMAAVFERFSQAGGGAFSGKIGARVLPDSMSVVDNPTLAAYGNEPLFGGYKTDADGVLAHETRVIEGGILKTLLNGRTPVEGVAHSTGNRRGTGAIPSNMIVESSEGLGAAELRSKLLELVKKRGLEFGIVVRELGSGSTTEQFMAVFSSMMGRGDAGRDLLLAYKVYPDGREELIRGARLSGMTAESFKGIVAASKEAVVFHNQQMPRFNLSSAFLSSFGAEMAASPSLPLASYVVPSLLFEDLSLTKPARELPKPPFSEPPPCTQ